MNKPGNIRILQDLPPRWARFCLDIQDFMESLVQADLRGRKLLVAFSGGADSTALLRVLDFIKPRAGISLVAVHLNHMLRTEADSEQEQAAGICSELDIPFRSARSRVAVFARAGGMGIEEAARTLRYRFLQAAAREWQADYIVTGHHLNDLAEDVLMRLGRGTAWPGLSGMSGFDAARSLVRPFLLTSRKTILDFLNMLNRDRLASKKISKTDAVQSVLEHRLADEDIHIGPSDYVPWQKDNKVCFLRMEGRMFGGVKMNLELRLSVEDSPNSAGVAIDAIRCCRLARDRGIGGALYPVSAYLMKHPPRQMPDVEARNQIKTFLEEAGTANKNLRRTA